jgi:transposase
MSPKKKTFRREHSSETVAIIISLKSLKKSHDEIAQHLKLFKSSVTSIIHRKQREEECGFRSTKRAERPHKLDARARRRLIRHVEANLNDDFATLTSPSKATHLIHRFIVRRYLRVEGYLRFKARKKSFLTSKHKLARLK